MIVLREWGELGCLISLSYLIDLEKICKDIRGTQRENFRKILELSFSAFSDCFRDFYRHICES